MNKLFDHRHRTLQEYRRCPLSHKVVHQQKDLTRRHCSHPNQNLFQFRLRHCRMWELDSNDRARSYLDDSIYAGDRYQRHLEFHRRQSLVHHLHQPDWVCRRHHRQRVDEPGPVHL